MKPVTILKIPYEIWPPLHFFFFVGGGLVVHPFTFIVSENGGLDQGQLQEWTEHCLTAILKIQNQ